LHHSLKQLHSVSKLLSIHIDVALRSADVAVPCEFGQQAHSNAFVGSRVMYVRRPL
jgi:hypothetical protein